VYPASLHATVSPSIASLNCHITPVSQGCQNSSNWSPPSAARRSRQHCEPLPPPRAIAPNPRIQLASSGHCRRWPAANARFTTPVSGSLILIPRGIARAWSGQRCLVRTEVSSYCVYIQRAWTQSRAKPTASAKLFVRLVALGRKMETNQPPVSLRRDGCAIAGGKTGPSSANGCAGIYCG